MKNSDITALFEQWNCALKTKEPKQVTELYEENAILLSTVSNKVRHNHEEIADYFADFMTLGPQGTIDESNIRFFSELAIHSGLYTFTFNDGSCVQARFTFVYRCNGQRWLIVEHHSSKMPE